MDWTHHCAAVIPCLNEAGAIGPLVTAIRQQLPAVIVVDDGSTDSTRILAMESGAAVLALPVTQGKGAALNAGMRLAHDRGFAWALLMDGDGQHDPLDIPHFFAAAASDPAPLIVGNRMAAPGRMPMARRWTNRFMSTVLSQLTHHALPDTQCGFRLIHLDARASLHLATKHFEVESEMLVAFLAAGHDVAFAPVRSIYKREQSKIRPVEDAVRWFRWLWRSRGEFARIRNQTAPDLRAASMVRVPK